MSQAGMINSSSWPVPPTVATSYVTDVNSPAIPSANVLNVLGNDTTTNNINGIQTDGSSGSNTLTVQLTNRLYGTASSVNAGNADIITFSLGATQAVYRFKFEIVGVNLATGDGVGYSLFSSAKTNGAVASLIQTPFQDNDEDPALIGATMSFVASGNNVILRGNGVGGLTINYVATGTYLVV